MLVEMVLLFGMDVSVDDRDWLGIVPANTHTIITHTYGRGE